MSYVHLNFDKKVKRKALVDTGACANAIPHILLDELQKLNAKIEFREPAFRNVKLASGKPVPVTQSIRIKFYIANHEFTDDFMVLPTMNSVIIGNPFFKKNSIWICPSNNLLKLPDMTVQLNEIRPKNQKPMMLKKLKKIPLFLSKKHVIPPYSHQILECSLSENSESFKECSGVVLPNQEFENSAEVAMTSSLSTIDEKGKVLVSAVNITDHYIHVKANTHVAYFEILSEAQASRLINIDPQLIALAKMRDPNDLENGINQLVQMECKKDGQKPLPEYEKFWFPTPETCQYPESLPPLQRDIYEQIKQFKNLEKIDPKIDKCHRPTFLQKFKWDNSILTDSQRSEVEELLVEFSDIFAKHRFDVGYNTELKIKLTPEHDLPVYV